MTEKLRTEPEMVRRTATYVDAVLTAVDGLPTVFLQRRTASWFGRLTMPGNRQLTRMFVNRQLGTNLRRVEAEIGLEALASGTDESTSDEIGKLARTVGVRSSKLIPIAIILGTVGLAVSLLSIAVPRLQEEATLLGAIPRVVSLDGARVAEHATAFDENAEAFSPADLEGVFTAALLAGSVLFILFAVLAGSGHAAAAILRDPRGHSTSMPFLGAVRNGPLTTQRRVFGRHPKKLYTPVSIDLIRDAALYSVLLLSFVSRRLDGFAAENRHFLKVERVGGIEMMWAFSLLLFPGALLTAYLVLRHRRWTESDGREPPSWWRAAIGALLALLAGGALLWSVLLASGARITQGPDLALRHPTEFMTVEDLELVQSIDGVSTQTLSYYYESVETGSGPVAVTLLVTELDLIDSLVSIDESELEVARLRDEEVARLRDDEFLPQVYVSDGLRERLDPATGDVVSVEDVDDIDDDEPLPLGIATVTFPYDSEELVAIIDVENFLEIYEPLLIDDILVQSADGPLRTGSAAYDDVYAVADELDLEVFDLRRERVTDRAWMVPAALLFLVSGYGSLHIAFGAPWRWRRVSDQSRPSARVGGDPPPPVPPPQL